MKSKFLSVVVLVCMLLMLVSCESFSIGVGSGRRHRAKHGPPPHAPAHGYRHKQHGVELVYDSGRGVYVVVDFPLHFYFEGRYYRYHEPHWEVGVQVDGPWESVSEEVLPRGLRAKGKGKSKERPGRGLGLQKKDK